MRGWLVRRLCRILLALLRRLEGPGGLTLCANRRTRTWLLGEHELTFTWRDTRQPDGYSREELYRMLKLVRDHEHLQEWRCPEPYPFEKLPPLGYIHRRPGRS